MPKNIIPFFESTWNCANDNLILTRTDNGLAWKDYNLSIEEILDNIDIKEIEQYLRRKKLNKLKND